MFYCFFNSLFSAEKGGLGFNVRDADDIGLTKEAFTLC
jgi:hypothetical protein